MFECRGRTTAWTQEVEQRRSSCRGRAGTAQWLTQAESQALPPEKLADVEQELADIQIYLIRIADKLGVDLIDAVKNKIDLNEKKYPVTRARGSARKYTEY